MFRIIHFDISADQPERAARFYREVFGWQIQRWDGPIDYWLVFTGQDSPGIDGGLGRRTLPTDSTINYVEVPSVEQYLEKVVANGGKVRLPKTAIPGVGYLATCLDTEGNPFGIMEADPAAN